jgi:hypothetical protein
VIRVHFASPLSVVKTLLPLTSFLAFERRRASARARRISATSAKKAGYFVISVASTIAYAASQSGGDPIDAFLAQLKNREPDVRIAALRELQTSLDPRIPDAMLPLLSDEGNSIRRLAARAIGSRWWQISKEKVPQFVEALRRNEKSEFEDERNMVARAIDLLTRNYTSNMVARSKNKRWVVYERRGLPCLIDTQTDTEELLGWPRDPSGIEEFLPARGNQPLGESALAPPTVTWHPTKEAVALLILQSRRATIV